MTNDEEKNKTTRDEAENIPESEMKKFYQSTLLSDEQGEELGRAGRDFRGACF